MIQPEKIVWTQLKNMPNHITGSIGTRSICDLKIKGDEISGFFSYEPMRYTSDDLEKMQNIMQLAMNQHLARNLIFENEDQRREFLSCHLLGIEDIPEELKAETPKVNEVPIEKPKPRKKIEMPISSAPPPSDPYEFA